MNVSKTVADTVLVSTATASVTQTGLDLLATFSVARVTPLVFLVMSIVVVMVSAATETLVLVI